MILNQLLVRHRDGYAVFYRQDSIDLYDPREGFLSLGALSVGEAERQAEAAFDRISMQLTAYTASVFPRAADVPLLDFDVGDTVVVPTPEDTPDEVRVLAVTITTTDNGEVQFVPELNDMTQENQDRLEDWLRSMANGALAGTRRASPALPGPPPALHVGAPPGWLVNGTGALHGADGALSDLFRPPRNARLVRFTAGLREAGATDTVVDVMKNGASVATLTLVAGSRFVSVAAVVDLRADADELQAVLTTGGLGAVGLVVAGWSEP